jgi:hypothetical protein
MSILILIQLCSIFSVFIHLWFNTDFFPTYLRLFKKFIPSTIYSWLMVDEFLSRGASDFIYGSYIEYLYSKKIITNYVIEFFIKLLSCPLCLSTWFSIFISLANFNILYFGISFVVIRCIDYILSFFIKNH